MNGTMAAVRDGFSTLRPIGGEHVIEGSIFSDDHDDMLDGRGCTGMLGGFLSRGRDRRSQVDKQSKQARANHKVLPGLCQQAGRRHRLPPWGIANGYQCKLMAAELRFGETQMNSRRKEIHMDRTSRT